MVLSQVATVGSNNQDRQQMIGGPFEYLGVRRVRQRRYARWLLVTLYRILSVSTRQGMERQ